MAQVKSQQCIADPAGDHLHKRDLTRNADAGARIGDLVMADAGLLE
jgi:hypothetical protein